MISVFTPIHKYTPKILNETYQSLTKQTFKDFEWVILLNGDALNYKEEFEKLNEDWIKIFTTSVTNNIGKLKSICCNVSKGDILVELDYDDFLTENTLQKINDAFLNEEINFVYSNTIRFNDSDGKSATPYRKDCGWKFRYHNGYIETIAFPALPQYLRRIEWAPDHVRSFRKKAYIDMGGYDETIEVGDDHDLICRFFIKYGEKGFHKIDEPLYYYRVYEGNTSRASNRLNEIQKQVDINYINHSEKMYLKWAKDNGLLCLDLGGRFNSNSSYVSVDLQDADLIFDLEKPWPLQENSVGVLRAYHLLEHLNDTIHFFNEANRVLVPGGFLLIEVPSVSGEGAFSDPTHVKFFNKRSFDYYTTEKLAKYIRPKYSGKFQKMRVVEYWWDKDVSVISANLVNLKGWYDKEWCGIREI